MSDFADILRRNFPKLIDFAKTSDQTFKYNCHAWGGDSNTHWWEPLPAKAHARFPWVICHWPGTKLYDHSLENFREAYAHIGFKVCDDGDHVDGVEKIAQYVKNGTVSHTARQLPWGTWTSKLGESIDIEHADPYQLEGPAYGTVTGFMMRQQQATLVPTAGTGLVT